ncbi:uncharacterized protein LOC128469355 [Spea bombifrons]|uniref:uncharacterized protein LOC128469355 n=1 Tax=Spea bombifrons TaxID=233779 RepID=UPI00234ACB16|nr:uncharacterized protein LOC128469355 [Spea bombifrons]
MASPQGEVLGQPSDLGQDKAGAPYSKPPLKPKPVLPPHLRSSHAHGNQNPCTKNISTSDSCPTSPPPDLPSAVKLTQLTGPLPYGSRRPSFKRWASGGEKMSNPDGSPLSPVESPVLDVSSKAAVHPVSALPKPFKPGTSWKGHSPFLLTSRGWGEQRWQHGRDFPESDFASKRHSSTLESKEETHENKMKDQAQEKAVSVTCDSNKENLYNNSAANKRDVKPSTAELNTSLEEVPENVDKVAVSCSESPSTSRIPKPVKDTDETQETNKVSLPEARLSTGEVSGNLGCTMTTAENTGPEPGRVSGLSLVSDSSKGTKVHLTDTQTESPKSDNLLVSALCPSIGTISNQGSLAKPSEKPSEVSKTVSLECQEYGDKQASELHQRLGHSLTDKVLQSPKVSTKVSEPTLARTAGVDQQEQPDRHGLFELNQEEKYSLPVQSPKGGNVPLASHLHYGSSDSPEQYLQDRDVASEQYIHNKPVEWHSHNKDNADMEQIQHNRPIKETEGVQYLPPPTKDHMITHDIHTIQFDNPDLSNVTSDLKVEEHGVLDNTNVSVFKDCQQNKEHIITETSLLEEEPGTGYTKCDLETTTVTNISQRDISPVTEKHTDSKTDEDLEEKPEDNNFDTKSKDNVEEMHTLLRLPEQYSEYYENVTPTSFASYETTCSRNNVDQMINEKAGKQVEHEGDLDKLTCEGDMRLCEDKERLDLNWADNKVTDHTLKPHQTQPSAYGIQPPKEQHENCADVQQGIHMEEQTECVMPCIWDNTEKEYSVNDKTVDVSKTYLTYIPEKVNEGFTEMQLDQTEKNNVSEAFRQPAENEYGKQNEECMASTTAEETAEIVEPESQLRSKSKDENVMLPSFHTMDYHTDHIGQIEESSNNEFVDTKTPDYVNAKPEGPQQIHMEIKTPVQHQHREAKAEEVPYKPSRPEELLHQFIESEELHYKESRHQSASPQKMHHVGPESESPENIYSDVKQSPPSDESEETKNKYDKMMEPTHFDKEKKICHVSEPSHYEHSEETDTVDAESEEKQHKFIESEKLHESHIEKWELNNTETQLSPSEEKETELYKLQSKDNEFEEPNAYTESGERQNRYSQSQEVPPYNNQSENLHHNGLILYNLKHGDAQSQELHQDDILSPKNQYSDIQTHKVECRDYQPQEGERKDYKSEEVGHKDILQSQEVEHKGALQSQEVEHRDDLQVKEVEQRDAPESQEMERTDVIQSQHVDHNQVEKLSDPENELQHKDSSIDEPDQTESGEPQLRIIKSQETSHKETESDDTQYVTQSSDPEKRNSQLKESPPDDFEFLEGTEILDTSSVRCRASLGRKRCHRTPPHLTSNNEAEDPEYWMFRDSTEDRPEKESDSEETKAISPECSPSTNEPATSPGKSHAKKSGIFAGIMNPNILKGRLKSRSKTTEEEPTKKESEESSLTPKSCSSPEKEKQEGSSLNWLSALKKKKKKAPK